MENTGYRHCACRDCFEIAIGGPGAVCHACEAADCDPTEECEAPHAYCGGGDETPEGFCTECGQAF